MKDIIATKTMPTTCGSAIYRDHVVGKDAACVTQLVKAGAIVLGKSVTTEFAGGHAGKTHNPHNLRHTPAGSSSGSAAAVADFMAPVGYGTQTAGSVIRPGAFNGVVAYKGSYGWADMTGIKPYAPSLDTLGFFAREANDLALIRAAYGHAPADPPSPAQGAPRIGLIRTPWWDVAERYNRKNIEEAARTLRAAGARVREWHGARQLGRPDAGPASHHDQGGDAVLCQGAPALLPPLLAHHARRHGRGRRRQPPAICRRHASASAVPWSISTHAWSKFDILLAPSAKGEAPSGLGNTGDPIFNRFWTLLGTPCIALPFNTGPFGMPLSVQLIGPRDQDDQLIAWARWVERKLS